MTQGSGTYTTGSTGTFHPDPPLRSMGDVPTRCATCGTKLGEHCYGATGVDGLFCSSACLDAACQPDAEG